MEIEGIDHVALAVADVQRAANWYADVLGLERLYEGRWNEVPTFIGKGTTALALFPTRTSGAKEGTTKPAGMLHLAFRADREDFLAAQEELKRRGFPLPSKITKYPIRFISAISTTMCWRSQPMNC